MLSATINNTRRKRLCLVSRNTRFESKTVSAARGRFLQDIFIWI